jgi:hypothetical protein
VVGRELWTGRLSTRPKDADINGDFSEFEDVVELIESLEVAPDPQVRAAHIRSAVDASSLFLLQRLGVAGVPLTRILSRAAAVLLVLAVGISAAGAAAALPAPLQNAVATVAGYVGIDMPSGIEEDSESGLLPALDEDSTPVDQPATRSGDEDDAGETGGASAACDDAEHLRHETEKDQPVHDECVDDQAENKDDVDKDDDDSDDDDSDDDDSDDDDSDDDKDDSED